MGNTIKTSKSIEKTYQKRLLKRLVSGAARLHLKAGRALFEGSPCPID